MEEITSLFNISDNVILNSKKAGEEISNILSEIDNISLYNQAKVMKAFKEFQVSRNAFWKDYWLWI